LHKSYAKAMLPIENDSELNWSNKYFLFHEEGLKKYIEEGVVKCNWAKEMFKDIIDESFNEYHKKTPEILLTDELSQEKLKQMNLTKKSPLETIFSDMRNKIKFKLNSEDLKYKCLRDKIQEFYPRKK